MSILLTIDANKYKGSKNHIVYKTQGRPPMNPQPDETANTPSGSSLGNVSAQIGPFSGPTLDAGSQKQKQRERLSDCVCYVCKLRLGSDHSKRIGKWIVKTWNLTLHWSHWETILAFYIFYCVVFACIEETTLISLTIIERIFTVLPVLVYFETLFVCNERKYTDHSQNGIISFHVYFGV